MQAYPRILDKQHPPSEQDIAAALGPEAGERLRTLERFLFARYQTGRELRFPFGNHYGWGYKYSHKRIHLCYAFFERNAFTVTVQIGDGGVDAMEAVLPELLPKTRELWADRYPCGKRGGWMHCRVLTGEELKDVCRIIRIKKKPQDPEQNL